MKKKILEEDQKRLQKLERRFKRNQDFDGSEGKCLCGIENEKATRRIVCLDVLLFVNLIRFVLAIWVLADEERVPLYARTRFITFVVEVAVAFVSLIGLTFYAALMPDVDPAVFVQSLVLMIILIAIGLLDYHFCKVVEYYAKGHGKRIRRKERERRRKVREETRKQREEEMKSQFADIDGDEGDLENPVVIPGALTTNPRSPTSISNKNKYKADDDNKAERKKDKKKRKKKHRNEHDPEFDQISRGSQNDN